MNGAALVAIVATIGNLLQGWDNATIAGMYLLPFCDEFSILISKIEFIISSES